MKRYMNGCLAFLLALLVSAPVFAQARAAAYATAPDIPFESVPNFLKMPEGLYLGEGIGVAVNSQRHVFVYTRRDDTRLLEFDQDGNFVKEWGVGLYGFEFAHKVRVDREDNVWAVDEGSNMVIKFNPEGRVVMVLGRRPEAIEGAVATVPRAAVPPPQRYTFGRPTDVAWDPEGNIFVSDGYINHRVVKYDKNGRYIREVGSQLRGTEPYQFNTPHTIAVDAVGNVYVGDRNNGRIQVFDNNLVLRDIYDNIGRPWEICITPGPHQYLYSSYSNPDSNPAASWATTGEIYKMELDGTVIGKFGVAGKALGEFQTVHGIDCRFPDELVVSEIAAWRVQKILLQPLPTTDSSQ